MAAYPSLPRCPGVLASAAPRGGHMFWDFGRAPWFCLVDTASGDLTMLENPTLPSSGGAGVQAAQSLADQVSPCIAPSRRRARP